MRDYRLVPLAVAFWLTTLAVPALPGPAIIVVIACSTVLALAALVTARDARSTSRIRSPGVAVVLLGIAVGSTLTALHVTSARSGPVRALAADAQVVTIDLEVRTDPRLHSNDKPGREAYVLFSADATRVRGNGAQHRADAAVVVAGSREWMAVSPGQTVRAVARLRATAPTERAAAFV